MDNYLKLFKTSADYEVATDKPLVSHIVEDVEVIQNIDPYCGHEYVEIGGLKWATMNIGANSVTDYGYYFQWGDTQGYTGSQSGTGSGQKPFDWKDYKYGNGTNNPGTTGMTKYNSTDGKTVLDAEDDAAQTVWGCNWRMPTKDEFLALKNATTSAWTTSYEGSGVAGIIVTSKTDFTKRLFFPAAGNCAYGRGEPWVGSSGVYWASTLYTSNMIRSNCLYYEGGSRSVYWNWDYPRHFGCPIRPVAN